MEKSILYTLTLTFTHYGQVRVASEPKHCLWTVGESQATWREAKQTQEENIQTPLARESNLKASCWEARLLTTIKVHVQQNADAKQ